MQKMQKMQKMQCIFFLTHTRVRVYAREGLRMDVPLPRTKRSDAYPRL